MQNGPPSIRRRVASLPTLVSLALAAAFLVFLLTRFDVDLAASWQQVKSSNPWYLVLACAVHYTTFAFRGARWRLLLHNAQGRRQAPPGVLYRSQLVLLGWFVNSVVWFRLGDAYRAYLYRYDGGVGRRYDGGVGRKHDGGVGRKHDGGVGRKHDGGVGRKHDGGVGRKHKQGASFSRTIGTILSERALDTFNVVLLLVLSAPFLARAGSRFYWPLVGAAAALMGLLALLIALIFISGDRWAGWLAWWGGPEAQWWGGPEAQRWLAEGYQRFRQGVVGSFGQLPLVALWGMLGWLAEIHRLYLVAAALGVDLSFPLIVFITLANSLLTLVPTPGGIGAVESGVVGLLLRLSSMSASGAAALVLLDRSITYLSVIAVGAVLFVARQARQRPATEGPTSSGQ